MKLIPPRDLLITQMNATGKAEQVINPDAVQNLFHQFQAQIEQVSASQNHIGLTPPNTASSIDTLNDDIKTISESLPRELQKRFMQSWLMLLTKQSLERDQHYSLEMEEERQRLENMPDSPTRDQLMALWQERQQATQTKHEMLATLERIASGTPGPQRKPPSSSWLPKVLFLALVFIGLYLKFG